MFSKHQHDQCDSNPIRNGIKHIVMFLQQLYRLTDKISKNKVCITSTLSLGVKWPPKRITNMSNYLNFLIMWSKIENGNVSKETMTRPMTMNEQKTEQDVHLAQQELFLNYSFV